MKITRWDSEEIIIEGKYKSALEAVNAYVRQCRDKGIRPNLSGANLSRANLSRAYLSRANLSRAYLSRADLSGADLSGANLSGANLSGADLSGAYLSRADLSGADLSRADLSGADLSGADLSRAYLDQFPQLNTPTISEYIKQYKIKRSGQYIYAFKGVAKDSGSPNRETNRIIYTKGIHKVKHADCDVWSDCSYGISLSPTIEAASDWGAKVLRVKVDIADVACIPISGHEGKFRVKRCQVLSEIKS